MNKYIALLLAGTVLAACKDSTGVPDLNNPSVDEVLGQPLTRGGLQNLATGYHDAQRAALGLAPANYIVFGEVMARDAYRIDASESRYVNEFLNGTPDASAFSGGGFGRMSFKAPAALSFGLGVADLTLSARDALILDAPILRAE